jgi:hypothetical protein
MTAQKLTVPAFFGVNADWGRIEEAGAAVKIVVPDRSFNELDGDALVAARAQFRRCRLAGQLVLGYVPTTNGDRPLSETKKEVRTWYGQDKYAGRLDGIFFDEGPLAKKPRRRYYEALKRYVSTQFSGMVFLNAAQFPQEWVMGAADYVILWEADEAAYRTQFYALGKDGNGVGVPRWWKNASYRDRIAHTILLCPTVEEMQSLVTLSRTRNCGLVYVYDKGSVYDRLPPYWYEELAAVSAP